MAMAAATLRGDEVEAGVVRQRDKLLPGTSFTFQPPGRKPVTDEEPTRAYLGAASQRWLPVVDEGRVLGIASWRDVLRRAVVSVQRVKTRRNTHDS
ncbi:hypothetical protein [Qaidamihabitans albus]|uniref:hypothetical protein n=1 Tax=Qaidamihabitans albus TaxID=2795733 RepID=UPI001B354A5A|nr:hypothetical protein [Qaidamihabitans albus]